MIKYKTITDLRQFIHHKTNLLIRISLGVFFFVTFTWLLSYALPIGVDWHFSIRPATLKLISGSSPYVAGVDRELFAGPPWSLGFLIPFAVFPEGVGRALLFLLSVVGFAFAAIRLGAKPVTLIAFLLSPPVVHSLFNGNLDWMPLIGFVLPPWIGLFFIAVKPQMGFVVAIFWFIEAWREGGLLRIAKVFSPVTIVLLASLGVYGLWPLNSIQIARYSAGWNASLWPLSLPVGLALTVAAIRLRRCKFAIAASPCLSPYVLFHAWSGALITLVTTPAEMIVTVVGLWILVVIVAFSGIA